MSTSCILIGGADNALWQYVPEGMTMHHRCVFIFKDGACLNAIHEYRETSEADTYRVFELFDTVIS